VGSVPHGLLSGSDALDAGLSFKKRTAAADGLSPRHFAMLSTAAARAWALIVELILAVGSSRSLSRILKIVAFSLWGASLAPWWHSALPVGPSAMDGRSCSACRAGSRVGQNSQLCSAELHERVHPQDKATLITFRRLDVTMACGLCARGRGSKDSMAVSSSQAALRAIPQPALLYRRLMSKLQHYRTLGVMTTLWRPVSISWRNLHLLKLAWVGVGLMTTDLLVVGSLGKCKCSCSDLSLTPTPSISLMLGFLVGGF
jgi:hypothetical protein